MALGMYWKNGSAVGAIFSMISGMVTWIYFEYFPLEIPALVPALGISLVTMIIGSLLWPINRFN
jgi:Na+/pantothenate symporter